MLTVTQEVYDAVVDHALGGQPEEVCGIVGGSYGEERSHATAVRRTENVAETPRSTYRIDPAEQLDVMEDIEQQAADGGARESADVVGFYHSHPRGPPRPSATDTAQATWEGYSYLIVVLSGKHPFVGSWRWTGERFEPEVMAIRGGPD